MPTDSGTPEQDRRSADLSRLPEVVDLAIRRRTFDRPRRVTTRGTDHYFTDAIEFEVQVSEPFPVRALWPVLWVGEEPLASVDVDGLTYRFYAFDPGRLEPGAPIALGWSSLNERRAPTRYRFALPGRP
jgi:hypothetical protein